MSARDYENTPDAIKIANKNMQKDNQVVLQGKTIFDFFFKWTEVEVIGDNQASRLINFGEQTERWNNAFQNIIVDIAGISMQSMKPMIEQWYDCFKKVIRLSGRGQQVSEEQNQIGFDDECDQIKKLNKAESKSKDYNPNVNKIALDA